MVVDKRKINWGQEKEPGEGVGKLYEFRGGKEEASKGGRRRKENL